MAFLLATARELRVLQWIKNLAVFASITFTGQLFNPDLFVISTAAFIAFCLVSSAGYVINDFFDLRYDRAHPLKKWRPLAAGVISQKQALVLVVLLVGSSLLLASLVTTAFFWLVVFYLGLQSFYSIILKQIAIVDILAIATGYFLRVIGGELATGFHISAWLVLTAISLSLFLAIGKRRAELSLLVTEASQKVRKSLTHYSEKLLDEYLSLFATSTFISYSLFTFLGKPQGVKLELDLFWWDLFPKFGERKWLMVTIPFVIFGLMRYMQDVYEKRLGERPEKVLFADKPLLFNVIVWGVSVIIILYFLPLG